MQVFLIFHYSYELANRGWIILIPIINVNRKIRFTSHPGGLRRHSLDQEKGCHLESGLYNTQAKKRTGGGMLARGKWTLKRWFWHTYDYLGTLIALNVVFLILSLPVITLPLALAGMFYVTDRIVGIQEVSVRDFFIGMRVHGFRFVSFSLVFLVCIAVLAVNVFFYIQMIEQWSWAAALLAGAIFWLMVFVCMVVAVSLPLLVKTDEPIKSVTWRGVLLVVNDPYASVGLFIGVLMILLLGIVTGAGFIFGALSASTMLCSTVFREMSIKHDNDSDAEPDEVRGWRDLFRPWDLGK